MKLHCVAEGDLPENKQYVLAHLTVTNWSDSDDEEGKLWKVVKFVRGISQSERDSLPDDHYLKNSFTSGDEWGNNKRPYVWNSFGPSMYWGQDVDYWMELPRSELSKLTVKETSDNER